MRLHRKQFIIGSLTALWLMLGVASSALAWWNGEWAFRKKIHLDTTPAGADLKENLNDFPLLVRLHAGNFNFAAAAKNGADIRFVGADDKAVLKHHIEKYDPADQMALVWVLIPKVPGGSNQDYVWLYYGNEAAPQVQDAKGTFDPGYVGVYHFAETEGPPRDQTGFGNHVTEFTGGQGLPSVIGNGIVLNGAGDRMLIPKSPSLDFTAGLSFSTWVKITGPQKEAYLFTTESEDQGLTLWIEDTRLFARIATGRNQSVRLTDSADLPLDSWQHVAFTAEPKGRLTLYLNGLPVTWKEFPGTMPQAKTGVCIGASMKGSNFLAAELDEVKISSKPRTEGWARAVFKSEAPDQQFQAAGDEEANEKGFEKLAEQIRYFRVIIKSMSLDGWGAIIILFVFGLVALTVVFTKTLNLILVRRGNRTFLEAFDEQKDPISPVAEEGSFSPSTMHRVHAAGQSELARLLSGASVGMDPARVQRIISSCKAAMDRGLVEENRKLNSWMVILTMAISGGPFLGLLGTVFGVMNTFAAMADAGEANLAGIAPGVASALAATVSGLLVAIPALFAYNYLASKIKVITAETASFADYYTLKLEGALGGCS